MQNTKIPDAAQLSLFPQDSHTQFWKQLNAGESMDCPCCRRFAKIYTRKLHSGIALQLIMLYRLGGQHQYIHASRLIAPGCSGAGDFSKAKYWGLIEAKEKTSNDKKSSGYWRLTAHGVNFILGHSTVGGDALIFDDQVLGFTNNPATIQEALGSKFNYLELMQKGS